MGRLTSDGFQPARHNLMIERPVGRIVAKATRMLFRNEGEAPPPLLSFRRDLGGSTPTARQRGKPLLRWRWQKGRFMAMPPIIQLKIGDRVKPRFVINPVKARNWKFARDSADIGGGLMPQAELVVAETSTRMGDLWVKLSLPGRDPPAYLKLAGDELGGNFDFIGP